MQLSKFPVLTEDMGYLFYIQLSIFSVVVVCFILLVIEYIKKKNNIT